MKKFAWMATALAAAACGSVDETRHLDGGNGDGNGSGSADAAPMGPAMLTVDPVTHEFGPVTINGMSAAFKVTFKNTGGETASGCTPPMKGGLHPGEFTLTNDTCGTNDLPGGASCTVDVVAKPTIDGIRTMTLSRTCADGGTATTTTNKYAVNRPMFIFVTSTEYTGNIGGLAGADAKCAAAGAAGNLSGPKGLQWKALISQKTGTQVDAKDRFVWTGPIYDISGSLVTLDPSTWPWVGVTNGSTIRVTEDGGIPDSYTLSATDVDGTAQPQDCNGWTDDTQTYFLLAAETGHFPDATWINSFTNLCGTSAIFQLYCVSQ